MFLLLIIFMYTYGFNIKYSEPKCSECKWFIPNKVEAFGQCRYFYDNYKVNNKVIYDYNYAVDCRDNQYLCGIKGHKFSKKLQDVLKEIENNSLCGEVNEQYEIDELEEKLEYYKKNDMQI